MLVGNKIDLGEDKRQVSTEEGLSMSKNLQFLFKEVSAKEGTAINDLFYVDIFDKISRKYGLVNNVEEPTIKAGEELKSNSRGIRLGETVKTGKKQKKKCCK